MLKKIIMNKSALAGLIIISILLFTAIFAPILTPNDPYEQSLREKYLKPGGEFPLGTDNLGRCVLSRIIVGARISLLVGLIATGISLVIGVFLGAIAGYIGGVVDNLIMRFMDIILAFPGILLAVALVSVLGPSVENAMIAIAVIRIPWMTRVTRSQVIAVREEDYVLAAAALGSGHFRVLFSHILRNIWAPILVLATLGLGTAIVTEAGLSFLGIGTQPPTISWGRMIFTGRDVIRHYPHMTIYPGLVMVVSVLGFNLLGDGLRDILDPRLKD